ncbi:bifunctional ornithine acetyltransferase/N-acetylglutamate synthase, partial [Parageobacillus toebii]
TAILTTDTVMKKACYQTTIDGKTVTIGGAAKGSGMIHPNMATMLAFVTTDANISSPVLQEALRSITDVSFNQITVDGDTSTNDMVIVMASGLAGNKELTPDHPD